MPYIDDLLNKITMYRLLLWGLAALAALAVGLSFVGLLAYDTVGMLISLAVLIAACYFSNFAFAYFFKATRNIESAYITALILFFILAPTAGMSDVWWTLAAGVIAMGSKYILAIRKKHVFNPAAITAVILSVAGSGMAIWWIATPVLLPGALVLGLLVVRKLRRFDLFWSFIITIIVATVAYALYTGTPVWNSLLERTTSWPFVFFATIMLTEPLTTPPGRLLRVLYGVIVALLCSVSFHIGALYSTPALALMLGNIFSYIVSPKQRLALRFVSRKQLSANVYEFAFEPSARLAFIPGQYMEWTLPHQKPDSRGNRRYFTIASAPGQEHIKLGVRTAPSSSSFKKALMRLDEGSMLSATSLAGDFTLPHDITKPLVFIAGGVGITPFASMLRDVIARAERRDIVLIYAASSQEDFAYTDLLKEAEDRVGLKVLRTTGFITREMIERDVPRWQGRVFYLSGPNAMVRTYRKLLIGLSVPRLNIKTDYFPGF